MLGDLPKNPKLDLIDANFTSNLASEIQSAPEFFSVSPFKFGVMATCTLGLYELYWFYKNWKLVKVREGSKIIPLLRGAFSFIFCFALISKIRDRGALSDLKLTFGPESLKLKYDYPAWVLCSAWIGASVMLYSSRPIWVISIFAWIYLLPAVRLANTISKLASSDHDENSLFSAWNWLAIVVGGACVVINIGHEILALVKA
jgi:hypothetical protein